MGEQEESDEQFGVQDVPWSWRQMGYVAFSGFCMGTADVVPGVSGGTMAVALGIYRQLLAAITSINTRTLKALLKLDLKGALSKLHWRFIASLGTGIVSAVVVMVVGLKLPHLVQTQTKLVYAVFFGLVLSSALVLGRRIPSWTPIRVLAAVAGAALGFGVVNMVPADTPDSPPFIFMYGVIAISAMLLPGISGSFILLILRKYAYILDSLSELLHGDLGALRVVAPFAVGCLVGLLLFARFLGWLLHKWEHTVMAVLTGLLIGSLWRIWPYQHTEVVVVREKARVISATPYWPESPEVFTVVLFLLGFVAVLGIEQMARKRDSKGPQTAVD